MTIAFPLGVLASHQFTDVPDSNIFHADISAVADAHVTTGCDVDKFCPKDFVTREQMAAFLNRLGALQAGKVPKVNADKVDGLDSVSFERSDVSINGHYTCAGPAMEPNVDAGWAKDNLKSWKTSATQVYFSCSVLVPNGATMTSVEYLVGDSNAGQRVYCDLVRTEWAVGHSASTIAAAATTYAGTPGNTAIYPPTITAPVVDNATYLYLARCIPEAPDNSTFVVGVRVYYTVTGHALP
jgi:hypothetical protein